MFLRLLDIEWRKLLKHPLLWLELAALVGLLRLYFTARYALMVSSARHGMAIEPGETRVAGCWVVRATTRNRRLVATYPELFATRFPGSSRGWLEALVGGSEPSDQPGLVWASADATRLFAHRWSGAAPTAREA